jgi:hypothetical protein
MSDLVGCMLLIWAWHAAIAVVLSSPIVILGRTRVRWRFWELLASVVPFALWLTLMLADLAVPKTLANLSEPFFISVAIPVGALVRVVIGRRSFETRIAAAILVALCLEAAAIFFFVPSLPE